MSTVARRWGTPRRERLLDVLSDDGARIILGEGWSYQGGRAFKWDAPTTEVNPTLSVTGVESGVAYRVIIQTTEFTGTGTVPVTLGGAAVGTISAAGTIDVTIKALADGNLNLVITTNATMTSITIKNLYIAEA